MIIFTDIINVIISDTILTSAKIGCTLLLPSLLTGSECIVSSPVYPNLWTGKEENNRTTRYGRHNTQMMDFDQMDKITDFVLGLIGSVFKTKTLEKSEYKFVPQTIVPLNFIRFILLCVTLLY